MRSALYTMGGFRAAHALARHAPPGVTHAVAVLLSRLAAPPGSPAYALARQNLQIVTGLEGAKLDRLCARNIREFSHTLADYFLLCSREPALAERLLGAWSGWEHIQQARAAGRGLLLLTGHLGHWELGGALLALRGIPITVITLEEPSSELTRWRDHFRRRLGIRTIAVGPGREFAFVEMLATLRRNECLAMLVDRPYQGTGLPVRFFGQTVEYSTAPALLWQHTDATVAPAFVLRRPDGLYTSFADPPLAFERGPDKRLALQQNTQKVASAFESIIRRFPDQWFNYAPVFASSSAPA